jgi:hypothetical protein
LQLGMSYIAHTLGMSYIAHTLTCTPPHAWWNDWPVLSPVVATGQGETGCCVQLPGELVVCKSHGCFWP